VILKASENDINPVGFPMLPFAVLWPLMQYLAVPLIKLIVPWLLERLARSIRDGVEFTLTDDDIRTAVQRQESAMRSVYRG